MIVVKPLQLPKEAQGIPIILFRKFRKEVLPDFHRFKDADVYNKPKIKIGRAVEILKVLQEAQAKAYERYLSSCYPGVPGNRLNIDWLNPGGMSIKEMGAHIVRGGHFSQFGVITPIYDLKLLEAIGAYAELRKVRAAIAGILELNLPLILDVYYRKEVQRVAGIIDAILEGRLDRMELTASEAREVAKFETDWKHRPPVIKDFAGSPFKAELMNLLEGLTKDHKINKLNEIRL